ncbi:cytidine and deoxycytidylate deaminase zinc-binding region [Oesophagostomum dentatum]|uniref:Cytidine and deoxycytidylate deaminase zinc-binding region n=1 Tax=Oesophagostomum dentatum TaxID=61180 RepID=A0A0B1SQD3_OESDE|nr:cytidine and deoxycytidylate deaminase zinc-binding region [Oesophagostomum dentatum]
MHAAIEEACSGVKAGDGGPFGAVIVKMAKLSLPDTTCLCFWNLRHEFVIVSETSANSAFSRCMAYRRYGTYNVLVTQDPTAHAEVTAIRNACKNLGSFDLSGCTMYTSCYPCPMCMGACLWAHLDAIYYGASAEQVLAY